MEYSMYDVRLDMWAIIERVKKEAEDTDQMAEILKWEIKAYTDMVRYKRPYNVIMYEETQIFDNWDKAVIGEFYADKEAWEDGEDGEYQYIVPISTIKDNHYSVTYKLYGKAEI